MFRKKKEKLRLSDFYPKPSMFHYINHDFFGDKNNKTIIAQRFYKDVGYYPNIDHPQTFNEKIIWLTQYYHNPLVTRCADKYAVKDYIKEQLGEDLCIPTLKTYKSVYDINLDELPDRFVFKINWGWGGRQVMVVKDKSKVSLDKIRLELDDWMQPWNNFYFINYSWAYKDMKPVIYAEKYLEQLDGQLTDYKVYCFNGKAKMTLVVDNRFRGKMTKTFFDNDWNILPIKRPGEPINEKVQKPKAWKQMLEIAEKLAKPFPILRVDFYVVDDKPYIGELTFHPGSGFMAFEPKEWDKKLGDILTLPK